MFARNHVHDQQLNGSRQLAVRSLQFSMLDPIDFLFTALVLGVAAFIIGAIGFGFGLTTTPFLLLYLDPQTVVIVVNAVAILAFGLMLFETRREVRYRELTPVALAGVLGVPVGVYALSALDPHALRIGIAVLVLALTVLVIVNKQWRVPKPRVTGPVTGFCASALVAGLAIGGPLLVLYLLGRGMDRQGVRASMSFLFVVMYSTALVGYAVQGLLTADRLLLTAAAVPAVALGFWLSVRLTGKMNAAVFRRVVVTVIAATSIMVLGRELLAF